MLRTATLFLILLLALVVAAPVLAQEEAHFEGFTRNTNPNIAGTVINGRGLVTALYAPLTSNFVANEYTWEILGLTSQGSVLRDSVYYTTYSVIGSTFSIYEDPAQDARPTYYFCPTTNPDGVYNNGAVYLRGHFTQYSTTFDIHADSYGVGTFQGMVNWDSGTHLFELPPGRRGSWQFGGSTTSSYACIPASYEQALTGRIFQVTTPVRNSTWGQVRRLYH
ncbi:MAG: hypothetical protein HZB25_10605 [Candidatus Eisenbacteria bacterium]|nr:hypothetical protein [Candidatus Eisenbacteria bacterium]